MRKRKNENPYRFRDRSGAGRNIEVMFDHIPCKWISTGTKDMAEAVLFAEEFLKNEGKVKSMPTLAEFAKDFFLRTDRASLHGRHIAFRKELRPQWYITSQRLLDQYVVTRFGTYPLDAINPVMVEDWLSCINGQSGEPLAGATRLKILQAFRQVMDEAKRLGLIRENPGRLCMSPSGAPEKQRRSLSIWEQSKLFPDDIEERRRIWWSTMWATYFSIMYDTGFRPQEVSALRTCDIYRTPKGMAVYTAHTMNTELHKPLERVKTSGKGMERRVGLLSAPTEALVLRLVAEEGIAAEDEYLFLMDRRRKDSWVFADTSNKHFKGVCRDELGIDPKDPERDVTQYSLRHTYATSRRGAMDENVLAITMGHSRGVRDDYDHRDAAVVIGQLEKSRDEIFRRQEEPDVVPLSKKLS